MSTPFDARHPGDASWKPLPGSARLALSAAPIAAFVVATGEMVLMTTPFAGYFYGAYSPALRFAQTSPWLSWLPEFWIAHIAPMDRVATAVKWSGVALAATGLALFLIHASYLYWMKYRRSAVATRLLYARMRHPQYTSLVVAGAGLALLWPRLVNLVLLTVMVGTYAALARHEESRLRHRFPVEYGEYVARTPNLLWRTGRLVLLGGLVVGGALCVRELSVRSLHTIPLGDAPPAMIVSYVDPLPRDTLDTIAALVDSHGETAQLLYVVRQAETLRHLLGDSGVRNVSTLAIPDADFFVVRALVHHPSGRPLARAHEALRLGVIRRPDSIYALDFSGEVPKLSPVPRPDGAYGHASVPLL